MRTPLVRYGAPVNGTAELFLKLENLQPVGSFKLRGAYNKVASLTESERRRGVITYSSGNHAQGVAYAARAVGAHATVVMPRSAPAIKADATRRLGAEIEFVGPASSERQARAEQLAGERGLCIIPPFDDLQIIAGQGTIGLELLEDMPELDAVLVPIGGGGLISGIAAAVKQLRPQVRVFGVEPELGNDAQRAPVSPQARFQHCANVQIAPDLLDRAIPVFLRRLWLDDMERGTRGADGARNADGATPLGELKPAYRIWGQGARS